MSDVRERLREVRMSHGLSFSRTAQMSGVSRSVLVRISRGEHLTKPITDRLAAWMESLPEPEADDPNEEWRALPGWEDAYEVSDHGRVRSLERRVPHSNGYMITLAPRIMAATPDRRTGHLKVALCRDGKETKRWLHQLVLEAFVGPAPEGLDGCHNDGDPTNNRPSNLRWATRSSNMEDKVWHATHPGQPRPGALIEANLTGLPAQ